jgi:hypothetical protein
MTMLDKYLEIAHREQEKTASRDRYVELMMKLPVEELLEIRRTGEIKLAYSEPMCAEDGTPRTWLDNFKDTPLFPQAIALEEEELKMQAADGQQDVVRDQERSMHNQERDSIRLQKKLLELELAKHKAGETAAAAIPPPTPGMGPTGMGAQGAGAPGDMAAEGAQDGAPGKWASVRMKVAAEKAKKEKHKKEPEKSSITGKPPTEMGAGRQILSLLLGGPSGYLGAMKGAPHGEALQGAIRGLGGYALGTYPGALVGGALGGRLGGEQGSQIGASLGGLAGGIGGYKILTNKYDEPKVAFAVTDEGHEFDAKFYDMKARHAAEEAAMFQGVGALGGVNEEGHNLSSLASTLRYGLSSPHASEDPRMDSRHFEYAKKKHEEGSNAWNPWGGMLTPSPHEEHATEGLTGSIGSFRNPHEKSKSKKKEASVGDFLRGAAPAALEFAKKHPAMLAGGALGALHGATREEGGLGSALLEGAGGAALGEAGQFGFNKLRAAKAPMTSVPHQLHAAPQPTTATTTLEPDVGGAVKQAFIGPLLAGAGKALAGAGGMGGLASKAMGFVKANPMKAVGAGLNAGANMMQARQSGQGLGSTLLSGAAGGASALG